MRVPFIDKLRMGEYLRKKWVANGHRGDIYRSTSAQLTKFLSWWIGDNGLTVIIHQPDVQVPSGGDLVEHEGHGLQVEDGRSLWQVEESAEQPFVCLCKFIVPIAWVHVRITLVGDGWARKEWSRLNGTRVEDGPLIIDCNLEDD